MEYDSSRETVIEIEVRTFPDLPTASESEINPGEGN